MTPGIRPGTIPPFHEIGEYPFQEMCRDLFFEEEEISTCEIFGTRGQGQFGIDLIAYRTNGDGIEVGQCKCSGDFPPREVRKVSDEFFKYWSRWSSKKIKRFILFVACDMSSRLRQEQILKETLRFNEYGITYEVWSAATIRNKLRPHPGIVATYCDPREHWIGVICGDSTISAALASGSLQRSTALVDTALISQLEQLGQFLSTDAEQRLESMRTAWREGRREEVVQWVKSIREDRDQWTILSPTAKAKIIRFEAGLALEVSDNLDEAKQLAEEARNLVPEDNDSRLRALIAVRETGPEAAIAILEGQVDIDSLNLRASLLLNLDKVEDCAELINFESPGLEPNADTFKLRAVCHLVRRDLALARLEIGKSLNLEPLSENIRFTSAVIDYFSALSPSSTPDRAVSWPDPVDWAFIKRDDESISRLRKSADVFLGFAENRGVGEENRLNFETWTLACLANDTERQEQAAEYCFQVLKENPTHYRFVSWACARNFDIDLTLSTKSLADLVDGKSASVPEILGLVSCHLVSRDFNQILQILNQTKSVFEDQHAEKIWSFWSAQIHAANGDSEAAMSVIDESEYSEELRHVRSMALRVQFEDTHDWNPFIEYLELCYLETRDSVFLYESCEFMAQQENWDYVADRAELLVEEVGTAEAIRLGAIALHNTNKFDSCLRLIDDHRNLYAKGQIPAQLRRLRVFCQRAIGDLPKAIEEAETLVREQPNASNLFELAQVYLVVGDFNGLVSVGRDILDQPDLSVEQAIWMCQSVSLENQRLAENFWRRAKNLGIPDDAVGKCVALGFQLDLENEIGELLQRMEVLGQQNEAGIGIMTFDDMVTFAKEQRARLTDLNTVYNEGLAAVHIIADASNQPLAHLYHRMLEVNESSPDPYSQPQLFARHGGRTLAPSFPDEVPRWQLHLDITAVLLAEHLEILDKVEDSFGPLRIPADLIPSLVRMRERLGTHQPSHIQACQRVIDLAEQGLLQEIDTDSTVSNDNQMLVEELGEDWVALFELARSNGGFLVDFLPLSKIDQNGEPSSLPDDSAHYLINCRAISDSLLQHGPLSQEEYNQALNQLGSLSRKDTAVPIPKPGSILYCHGNIPEVLADADLLRIICDRFQLYVEAGELNRVRSLLRDHRSNETLADWVNALIDKLNQGIRHDKYLVMPIPAKVSDNDGEESREGEASTCLRGLLGFEPKAGDVVWIDDRYLNSFQNLGSAPLIGINEILKALVTAGLSDKNGYYEIIARLRAGNVRYVPVDKDEIIYHLEQASVRDEVVVETQGLMNLRRYLSAVLLQGGNLQNPSNENVANKNGEMAFILSVNRAVSDSLIDVWTLEDQGDGSRRAKSSWIIDNLYIDYLGLLNITSSPNLSQDDLHTVGLSLVGLISQAMKLITGDVSGQRTNCTEYFEWLHSRLLSRRFEADPQLIRIVTELLKKFLTDTQMNIESNENSATIALILQRLHQELPEEIRNELSRDDEFMGRIGLRFQTVVSIAGLGFDPSQFWGAASEAINGRETNLRTVGSNYEVTFRPVSATEIRLIHSESGEEHPVAHDLLPLLDDSPSVRESVLQEHHDWFDCPAETLALAIAEVASIDDPFRRIEAVNVYRDSSASYFYKNLFQNLKKNDRFDYSDIRPPTSEGLVQHFRLQHEIGVGSEFLEGLETAAQTLIEEDGLEEAIRRFSGFPIALPNPITNFVESLSDGDRRDLFKQLLKGFGSPVSKIHLVSFLMRFAEKEPAYLRLARRITLRLFSSDGTEEIEAFFGVLGWVYDDFGRWTDARDWSAQVRLSLSWAHANHIFEVLVSSGAPIPWLRSTFSSIRHQTSPEMFNPERDNQFDVSHPRLVGRMTFLISGLSYCRYGQAVELIDETMKISITDQAFSNIDGNRIPDSELLRASLRSQNSLNSFLNVDLSEDLSGLVGDDAAGQYSQSFLQMLANQALDNLGEESDDYLSWITLYALLGNRPLEQEIAEKFESVVTGADFVAMFEKDPILARVALSLASMQAGNFQRSTSRQRLIDALIGIGRSLSQIDSNEPPLEPGPGKSSTALEEVGPALLEIALNLSVAVGDPKSPPAEFARLVTELVEICTEIIPMTRPVIQNLCEELPIAEAQQFWALLLRMRTLR